MKKVVDLLVHWCSGALVRWCAGALVLFRSGALVLWCSILMALSFSGVSYGETTIEDILERARAKYLEFREIATDITILRTVTVEGETIEERIYKKGEMFRVERVEPPGITVINIYDGENFWRVIPERGVRQKLSLEEGGRKRDTLLFENWFNFFYGEDLKFDRRERLGDRDCYVLRGRDNLLLWIDRDTLALIKIEAREDEEENEENVTATFFDFEVIGGREVPLSTKVRKNDKIVGSSSLKLDIETVLSPILFSAESIEIEDPPPDPFLPLD